MAETATHAAAGPALAVADLQVYYGRAHALQGVSLTLDQGVLAVVGRNGMGKTTLCNTIMGLVPATGGSIRAAGVELLGLPTHDIVNLGIGYVPQGRRVWPSLTVDEHLRLAGRRSNGRWTVARIYETFPQLAERRRHGGAQLSGGEQQMLAISRALMARPRMMLLDEPSLGLAPRLVKEIFEIIVRINREQGVTVLLVEQNANIALHVADYGYVLEVGRIVMADACARLLEKEDIKEFYLGIKESSVRGTRRWKRKKTWR